MKILLLEDDIMLNKAIKIYLESTGHVVHSVMDGKHCIEILEKEQFDLLVFDINVPDVDGLTILEDLHKQKEWFLQSLFLRLLISKILQGLLI